MDIIIESPKGGREKYKYDEKHNLFRLHKVLPAALVFPYPFGFIPGTKGEDGDPLDAFIIGEFKGFPGCIMECRLIGCITVEQVSGKKSTRNDRFLAVPEQSDQFNDVETITEMKPSIISLLENFLTTYMKLEGKEGKLLGNLNASSAVELINKAR